jgi:FtsZ-binding cell division protein ZapB
VDIQKTITEIEEIVRDVDDKMQQAGEQIAVLSRRSEELQEKCEMLSGRLHVLKQKTNALHQGIDLLQVDVKVFPNADVSEGRKDIRKLESVRLKKRSRELLAMLNGYLDDVNAEQQHDSDVEKQAEA